MSTLEERLLKRLGLETLDRRIAGWMQRYGVTTTRDPQTSTTDVLTYADKVRSGRMLGPRIYSTGPGVFQSEQIESLDDARNLKKNPLDNLRHMQTIRYVMKNGRLYEGDTLDEVYPRSRELPMMWWQRRGPAGDVPGVERTPDGVSLDESLQN